MHDVHDLDALDGVILAASMLRLQSAMADSELPPVGPSCGILASLVL